MAPALKAVFGLSCVSLMPCHVTAATAASVDVCTSFSCASHAQVSLTEQHWHRIGQLFAHIQTAADERTAISRAIGMIEGIVGPQAGTDQDKAENWRRAGEPGELDCIAESRNTHRYLLLLAERGLLRWHDVAPREQRGWVFTHWTAVIIDREDHSAWAVDSWFRDNARPAVVIRMDDWHAYREPDE